MCMPFSFFSEPLIATDCPSSRIGMVDHQSVEYKPAAIDATPMDKPEAV